MAVENDGGKVSRLDEGIFLISSRRGGGSNVFVLKGQRKNTLIDVGLENDREHIVSGLAEIGLSYSDIHLVLLTHEHMDHVGGVPDLEKSVVVAAHGRVADKVRLNDQFSTMSGAFGGGMRQFHVDIHLEDNMIVDIGDIRLRVIHTPGHSSGSVCFYESSRGLLFTGDTVFAGGVLGGIFSSGNLSDYISSLERLRELRLSAMYPSHGRMSTNPHMDMERALKGSRELLSDTRLLFDAVKVDRSFEKIVKATAGYSKRAAERRRDARIPFSCPIIVHRDIGDSPNKIVDISQQGVKLTDPIDAAIGSEVSITIPGVSRFLCRVADINQNCARLEFVSPKSNCSEIAEWFNSIFGTVR